MVDWGDLICAGWLLQVAGERTPRGGGGGGGGGGGSAQNASFSQWGYRDSGDVFRHKLDALERRADALMSERRCDRSQHVLLARFGARAV
eukprot:COSAG01_NODE_171_length_23132_cov_53.865118_20_plen_90_part_00